MPRRAELPPPRRGRTAYFRGHGMASEPRTEEDLDGLLRGAASEMRRRLGMGLPASAASFLGENPSLASDPERAARLLLAEFEARVELGQRPRAEEWL